MGIGSCNLQIIIPFSNGGLIFASFWLSFKRFDQDWKSLKTHIIAYNDEFYLPKSFTQLDSEDIFNIGRYFLMMLKKKEALFQNKQTPSMPAVAYYMLLINIDLAWKGNSN